MIGAERKAGRSGWALGFYTALIYGFFYLPIVTLILFAFDAKEVPGLPLKDLTLGWFAAALSDRQLLAALSTSVWVALLSASLAVLLAMPAALALAWVRLPAKPAILGFIIAPMVVPHLVLGLGLLLLFRPVPGILGVAGVVIAHTTLNLCYATMILYSHLLGFQRSLVEAARDLGASEIRMFWEVVLPLSAPAILAAFLMSFTLSFGEFVAAWFVAGFERTLPIEIWAWLRHILSPKINAIATVIVAVSVAMTILAQLWILRRRNGARGGAA
ncbi:MAG: ABC transporter permease [Rhodospirillales bacterium]|nr:ABC transporter permease [Rhodospirillales bacterium]